MEEQFQQHKCMIILCSYYLSATEIKCVDCIKSTCFEPLFNEMINLVKGYELEQSIDKIENEIFDFKNNYSIEGYFEEAKKICQVGSPKVLMPIFMLLDYAYSPELIIVDSQKYVKHLVRFYNIVISYTDSCILNFYINNCPNDFYVKRKFRNYIESFDYLERATAPGIDTAKLLLASSFYYKNSLSNKFRDPKINKGYGSQDLGNAFLSILSLEYKLKTNLEPVLLNFMKEISECPNLFNDSINKTQNTKRKVQIGSTNISKITLKNKTIGDTTTYIISYQINNITKNTFFEIENLKTELYYFLYTDVLALICVSLQNDLFSSSAKEILRKYTLLYFRTINIDNETYSALFDMINESEIL